MDILEKFKKLAWCKPDWGYPSMSKETKELLQQCIDLPIREPIDDVEEIIRRSKEFPIPFPIETVRLESLKAKRPVKKLKQNIESTYTVIHERVLLLIADFLVYKRNKGSAIEKDIYKDMTVPELIDRLLKKRAVCFMCRYDKYMLLSGEKGVGGWEAVGTHQEKTPLLLDDCLSYDEIKLSAMVNVSGYTECINNGSRRNAGIVEEEKTQKDAVIMGLIGPRFKRKDRMDCEDALITEKQNRPENGFGEKVAKTQAKNQPERHMWRRMWAEFYQVHSYTYSELTSSSNVIVELKKKEKQCWERFGKTKPDTVFDNEVYYKRVVLLAEAALFEAEARGQDAGKNVFLNVIGCGLGVWKESNHQLDVYILTFLERIQALLEKELINHVTDVNFAYIKPSRSVEDFFSSGKGKQSPKWTFLKNGLHPKGGVKVILESREPASRLEGEDEGKLLVLTYPWDGNAHPGNEFWFGKLTSSGDPAAACSTQISELHNAHINPAVNGYNVKVAGRHGLKTLSEYCLALTKQEGQG